ncbi:hypothetical protein BDV11DRAFT_200905 [Aspergillus similis]
MAITPIPKPKEAKLIKLNVRTWELDVWEFCKIQEVWEQTTEYNTVILVQRITQ